MEKTETLICICLLVLLTACNNYSSNDNCDRNHINKEKLQTEEQITQELETITLFYDCSGATYFVSLMSNDLISMVESGNNDIDTLEFTDKNDKLFIDLQRLLRTAKIDSAMQIGDVKIDSIYEDVLVRNDAKGYIIDNGLYTYIIPTTDPEYEVYKKGMWKDIALNDTATKKKLVLVSYQNGENDIQASHMLLYQYKGKDIPNDTLCFGSSDKTVRINSFIAEVDSILLKDTSNKITELTIE